MSDNTFDYIIVGGGTAGSLLANRLSADAHRRVLLIEAGKKDDYHWVHIPVAGRLQQHQRHDLHARTVARLRAVGPAHGR